MEQPSPWGHQKSSASRIPIDWLTLVFAALTPAVRAGGERVRVRWSRAGTRAQERDMAAWPAVHLDCFTRRWAGMRGTAPR